MSNLPETCHVSHKITGMNNVSNLDWISIVAAALLLTVCNVSDVGSVWFVKKAEGEGVKRKNRGAEGAEGRKGHGEGLLLPTGG